MSLKNRHKKQKRTKIAISVFVIFLIWSFFPIRKFFAPRFLFQKQLILLTNEAESRGCGGFLTAFGVARIFPPKFELRNSYSLKKPLGKAEFPISKISNNRRFWDVGIDPNLEICVADFKNFFEKATEEKVENAILVDFSTISKIFEVIGEIKFDNETWNSKNLFAKMSRKVANTDRHDEKSLAERKIPLAKLGKKMIFRAILRPNRWRKISKIIEQSTKNGSIFAVGISPEIRPKISDFAAIEWNLGGGKSSRFLKKSWKIEVREKKIDEWDFSIKFSAKNTGGFDEPLGQTWKGGFELIFPRFLEEDRQFLSVEIEPGDEFLWSKNFSFSGKLPNEKFSIFRHRGQEIFADVSISIFPQQKIIASGFETRENTGYFFGKIKNFRKDFRWRSIPDKIPPFLVLHEKIPCQKEENSNFCVEIHFNEQVQFKNFDAWLADRNFSVPEVSEDPIFLTAKLFQDNRTAILQFSRNKTQDSERFFLKIRGAVDFFGNSIKTKQQWTIVE